VNQAGCTYCLGAELRSIIDGGSIVNVGPHQEHKFTPSQSFSPHLQFTR
jgi:hypothetical protein